MDRVGERASRACFAQSGVEEDPSHCVAHAFLARGVPCGRLKLPKAAVFASQRSPFFGLTFLSRWTGMALGGRITSTVEA